MRRGRLRTGLGIAASTAIGLSLALTANYLALAQSGQNSSGRDPAAVPPYPIEGEEAVSKPPAAPATPHTVACSESFGKDSSHLKLAMSFGFRNVTATEVEAKDGTKVAASVIFPDDPQRRLEVWWKNASSGTYLIVINGQSDWTAPGRLHLGLTLAELEKLNHKSFKLKGFDKDGIAAISDWGGGELASLAGGCDNGVNLHADPKVSAKIIGALSPNKEYASSNPQMRAAKPTVSEILIGYPTDAPATAPQALTQQRSSEDCWMETEQGAKSLPLDKRAKLVDKCVKDKMSGAKTTDAPATEAAPQSSSAQPSAFRPFGPTW
jgi:hypothetical protein